MTGAPVLVCSDPKTYRSHRLEMSKAVAEVADPGMVTAMIGHAAATIGRLWVERYAVPFPTSRVVWTVEVAG